MGDEATVVVELSFAKGNVSGISRKPGAITIDVTGSKYQQSVQDITTSEAAINLGGLAGATLGLMYANNLDATNFIEIRAGTGAADVVKIKAGEAQLFRLATNGPWAIADTGTCEMEYLIIED